MTSAEAWTLNGPPHFVRFSLCKTGPAGGSTRRSISLGSLRRKPFGNRIGLERNPLLERGSPKSDGAKIPLAKHSSDWYSPLETEDQRNGSNAL